jgi:cytochrome c oxidase subunit 1
MLFAFMCHITQSTRNSESLLDWLAFWAFAVGGFGFVIMFLWGGVNSVPRRWAVHFPEWLGSDRIASIFAAMVVLATLVLLLRFFRQLKNVQIVSTRGYDAS